VKLLYSGEVVGEVMTNHSMTVEETCALVGIDLNEMEDETTPKWDIEFFAMEY